MAGLASPLMLEKIDKLFACGVGEYVDLPQIVVVGDESCGKSSVLEGLIKKPLPRDSGLCTRFATQIVFRRAAQSGIFVSIMPEQNAPQEHISSLRAWAKSVPSLDSQAFVDIMREVHEVMGLSGGVDDTGARKPTFSNDVLRLEICGPDQEHLSVIDIPGIFKSTTEGLTTKADIQLVRNMVKSYMDNPRSVILAVIPANVDVATQEILELAGEADPQQDRTLGVLTKPDLVDKGAEPKVIELLEGRARSMKLGWHMIRNPGQLDLANTDLDRDSMEADFFRSQKPWDTIDKDKVGIDALKGEARDKGTLDSCQKKLNDLGPERSGLTEQRTYLTQLATRFQRLVAFALKANHGADSLFDSEPELRVSPAVMARMKTFSDDMWTYGHMYSFLGKDQEEQGSAVLDAAEQKEYSVRKQEDLEELPNIQCLDMTLSYPKAGGIKRWLRDVFESNRGFELGTFNASILATVMKKQSSKWEDISTGFVSDVVVLVHKFVHTALTSICADGEICRALLNTLFDNLVQRYQKALDSAKFLVEVENGDTPMTLNHYFNDNLQKSRHGKAIAGLEKKAIDVDDHPNGVRKMVPVETAIASHNMSNDDHVILEIHDILQSYYKVSLKTFVDNVCKQAVIHFLLSPDRGPLALFSPNFVAELSPEQLEEIAGEAPAMKRLRGELKKEMARLTEAMKILVRA
ncbi:interferon-induced GTP-binding mx2 [Lecanosticta acicola]|uniref:Interferon-induced GTP-binding mx2 n=1 Tax=Lecanosticta acicola TaxID=111012 RepID=A0AAI8Z5X5_9PEZI|nr:interferon-induced GTP-binding mx2 [Lecanosticta acicola]